MKKARMKKVGLKKVGLKKVSMRKITYLAPTLLIVSCAVTEGPALPDGTILRTANDLPQVTCQFHTQAQGLPPNNTDIYVGEGSVAIRRAQRECYEQELD